jgi:hypothetical protein
MLESSSEEESSIEEKKPAPPPSAPRAPHPSAPRAPNNSAPNTRFASASLRFARPPPIPQPEPEPVVQSEPAAPEILPELLVPITSAIAADTPPPLQGFTLSWTKKHGAKQQIRLFRNDLPVFFSKLVRNGLKSHWLITRTPEDADRSPPSYIAQMSQSGTGRRFDLRTAGSGTDSVGIGFIGCTKQCPARAIVAVAPKVEPYWPGSEDRVLSRLAKAGTADFEKFRVYRSRLPARNSEGKLTLSFGEAFVVRSLKNFIVDDEQGQCVMMIFRSSSGTCSLKVSNEMPALTAFAIAVSVVIGDK